MNKNPVYTTYIDIKDINIKDFLKQLEKSLESICYKMMDEFDGSIIRNTYIKKITCINNKLEIQVQEDTVGFSIKRLQNKLNKK